MGNAVGIVLHIGISKRSQIKVACGGFEVLRHMFVRTARGGLEVTLKLLQ